jgi:folylpolyglutamate synthase/dihydropteroate synthase
VHQLILTAPEQPRAFRPEALARLAAHPNQRIAPNLRAALAWPIDCDFLLITGSLYLVGEARSLFVQ